MTTSTGYRHVMTSGAALVAALLVVAAPPARAQAPATDARWQAWLGCWAPATRVVKPRSTAAAPLYACVVPATGSWGVDIATVADTQLVTSDRVEATGERRPISREGCTGWASAQWSPDGRRVYVHSQYDCAGGLQRTVSGLMAIAGNGDWLDVQAVTTGDRTAVRALRYRAVEAPGTLPAEVAAALARRGPDGILARGAAAAPLTTADVAEAAGQVDSAVVEAWLGERGQGFDLNGRRLLGLADAGVPGGVIDVMVALSYPRTFTVGTAGVRQAPLDGSRDVSGAYGYGPYGGYDPYGYYSPYGLDPWFRSGMGFGASFACGGYGYSMSYFDCSPYWNGMYGMNPYGWGYGFGRSGYNPYGYYGGYNGWQYGGGIIVIQGSGAVSQPPHGQVVAGRGYTRGGSSGGGASDGRGAQPRERPQSSTAGSGSGSSGSSQPRSGGGSGSGSSGSSSSGSSSSGSSSSGGRTAHPRPPSR